MPEPASDDIHLPDIHSPEHRRALRERGAPHGEHVKPDEDAPPTPHPDANVAVAEIMADFRDYRRQRDREEEAQKAPHRPSASADLWKTAAVVISAITLSLTIAGSAQSFISSNTKLMDKIDAMDARLAIVEKRQVENLPRLEEQIRDNKLQDQRFQNMVESQADERKARQQSDADHQKAQVDILAMIARLTERIADLDKAQAIQSDRQNRGHTELGHSEKDAMAVAR